MDRLFIIAVVAVVTGIAIASFAGAAEARADGCRIADVGPAPEFHVAEENLQQSYPALIEEGKSVTIDIKDNDSECYLNKTTRERLKEYLTKLWDTYVKGEKPVSKDKGQ